MVLQRSTGALIASAAAAAASRNAKAREEGRVGAWPVSSGAGTASELALAVEKGRRDRRVSAAMAGRGARASMIAELYLHAREAEEVAKHPAHAHQAKQTDSSDDAYGGVPTADVVVALGDGAEVGTLSLSSDSSNVACSVEINDADAPVPPPTIDSIASRTSSHSDTPAALAGSLSAEVVALSNSTPHVPLPVVCSSFRYIGGTGASALPSQSVVNIVSVRPAIVNPALQPPSELV